MARSLDKTPSNVMMPCALKTQTVTVNWLLQPWHNCALSLKAQGIKTLGGSLAQ